MRTAAKGRSLLLLPLLLAREPSLRNDVSASKGRLNRPTRACAAETRRQPSMMGEQQTPESNAGLSAGAGVANQHSKAQHAALGVLLVSWHAD
jgi:hypothetical protein